MFAGPTKGAPTVGLVMLTAGAALPSGRIVALSLTELLLIFASVSFALANAVVLTVFPWAGNATAPSSGSTTIVTTALLPAAIVSSLQTTVASVSAQLPWVELIETNWVCGDNAL